MAIYKQKGGWRKAIGITESSDENIVTRNIVVAIAVITALLILYICFRLMVE